MLEHYISEELEALIAAKLGEPSTTPTATRSRAADLFARANRGPPAGRARAGLGGRSWPASRIPIPRCSQSGGASTRQLKRSCRCWETKRMGGGVRVGDNVC